MKYVKLSEITESIDYGVTASASAEPIGPQFLRITDIQNGSVDWSSVPFCTADERKLKSSRLISGDIVFARTGATTGKSFLIRNCPEHAVFASYLIRVRPSPRVDPLFLAHFFDSPNYWQQIYLKTAGAAQPGVNSSKLSGLEVPLPPFKEQKRIAAILDQADGLRRKRRLALDALGTIFEAIFAEVCRPSTPVVSIGSAMDLQLLLQHKDGNHGSLYPRAEDFGGEGVPFVSAKSISESGYIDDRLTERLAETKAAGLRHGWIEPGDVLLAHNATVGKVGLYCGEYDRAVVGTSLTVFRPNRERLLPEFLFAALRARDFQSQLAKNMGQTTRNQVPITAQRSLTFPIPTIETQRLFAEKATKIDSIRKVQRVHLAKLDALFASLQQRAFSGELVVDRAAPELEMAG